MPSQRAKATDWSITAPDVRVVGGLRSDEVVRHYDVLGRGPVLSNVTMPMTGSPAQKPEPTSASSTTPDHSCEGITGVRSRTVPRMAAPVCHGTRGTGRGAADPVSPSS
jgi:hypothetical protein